MRSVCGVVQAEISVPTSPNRIAIHNNIKRIPSGGSRGTEFSTLCWSGHFPPPLSMTLSFPQRPIGVASRILKEVSKCEFFRSRERRRPDWKEVRGEA